MPTMKKKLSMPQKKSDSHLLSVRVSPLPVVEAVWLTISMSSKFWQKMVLMPHPLAKSSLKNLFLAGKNTKWKSSVIKQITASSSARLKTLILWEYIQEIVSLSPQLSPSQTKNIKECEMLHLQSCVRLA